MGWKRKELPLLWKGIPQQQAEIPLTETTPGNEERVGLMQDNATTEPHEV